MCFSLSMTNMYLIFFNDYVKFDPYVTISTTFITYNSEFDIVKMLQPWVMNVTQILESLIGVRQRTLRARLTHSFRHPSQHPGWFLVPSDNVTVEHYGTGSRKKNRFQKKEKGKFYFDILIIMTPKNWPKTFFSCLGR